MTYGDDGEVFIFTDAAQEGLKLRGPSNLSAPQRKKLRARKPMKT